ncbi:MAG: DUF1569 domain-containing protein [bacterium]|nr:DUF1569 domain-containing protein [bacterium]
MALPRVFDVAVSNEIIQRIKSLNPNTQAIWGKMNVAQMLAHCNVTYEMLYENKHPKPNFVMKFILKSFVKPTVTNETPYKKVSQTAPAFIIKDEREFEMERERLIQYILKTQALGASSFEGKESHSFGHLTANEWNNLLYKHLDHHLRQFGA